jgi:hypothetical protein
MPSYFTQHVDDDWIIASQSFDIHIISFYVKMNVKIHQDHRKFVITPKGRNLYIDVK